MNNTNKTTPSTISTPINYNKISKTELVDLLKDLMVSVDELAIILAFSSDTPSASTLSNFLSRIVNSTKYDLTKLGGM